MKNIGNGFLYTIGKIIAYIFVGLVIGTLLYKFPVEPTSISPIIKGVNK